MLPDASLSRIKSVAAQMDSFEASASVANTGTGARREGGQFETLVATFWQRLVDELLRQDVTVAHVSGPRGRSWQRISRGGRSVYLPATAVQGNREEVSPEWLRLDFSVSELVSGFPGDREAVARYAPQSGPFARDAYPNMYSGLQTKFDDVMLFEDAGVLSKKTLFEYKTAKSSAQRQIDGNAHERLSFQIMQYLEVATKYPSCNFVVICNGALHRYRNKYHVNFHIQADRLSCFRWFSMSHLGSAAEYMKLVTEVTAWLGQNRGER